MLNLGPFNRSPTQNRVSSEKISFLEVKIMNEAELIFNMPMDHRFENIIPYFTNVRPSLDLMSLVSQYEARPTVYATFISRQNNSCKVGQNNSCQVIDQEFDDSPNKTKSVL